MKIRTRSRLILGATLLVFLVVLGFITQSVILQSFSTIEEQEMTSHGQRFISQLNNEIEDVAATCRDWSGREETVALAADPGTGGDSVRVFQPMSMKNLGIDYIIIYNASGQRIFSETVTKDGLVLLDAPPEIDTIVRQSILPDGMSGGVSGRRGISSVGSDPVILAGYPIQPGAGLPANANGGTLVMARLLDAQRLGTIDQMLQLDGTLGPYDTAAAGSLSPAEWEKARKGAILVTPVSDNSLVGMAIVTGIENKPSFLLMKITSTRPVYQEVKRSILIVAAAILILSLIFVLVVQYLIQRFILTPLSNLDNGMKAIAESGDISVRMEESGDAEIASLTCSLNHMLTQIEQQKSDLHCLLEEIEQQRDDIRDARQELAERNRVLEELNRKANLYLDIYLDAITYEILNAIMGLRGYAEMFRETSRDSERKFADKIIVLAQKSAEVIRNIETISRIYKNPPELKAVSLLSIIKKEMETRAGASIQVEHCNRTVLANDMLGVIFDNLFSNSLKFGGRDTRITVTARDTPEGRLEISVTDTGPGIPDSMKPLVFDRFMQDSRKRSSYGLGLHIVKMLVESYGGTVRAEDRIPGDPLSGAAIRFTIRPA